MNTIFDRLEDSFEVDIDVTEEDILNGNPLHAYSCPVALAAKRGLHKNNVPFVRVRVTDTGITVYQRTVGSGIVYYYATTPESLRYLVHNVDRGFRVHPVFEHLTFQRWRLVVDTGH